MNTDEQLESILDKFGGLLLGNWQPMPGEEGMVYPVRLQNEAKSALKKLINEVRIEEAQMWRSVAVKEVHISSDMKTCRVCFQLVTINPTPSFLGIVHPHCKTRANAG